MFYTLVGGVLHHAIHLTDALLLMTAAKVENINTLVGSRILIFSAGKPADKMALRLQRSGAFVKALNGQERDVLPLIKRWHSVLLIITDWTVDMAPWLNELLSLPVCTHLSVLALGADDEAHAMSALDAGASAYLADTVTESVLRAQIGTLLKSAIIGRILKSGKILISGSIRKAVEFA